MHLLAIVAHPDDADIFCGGTIAKHADRGDTVTIAHMTRGEYGGLGSETEAEIATVRESEARASGEVLGAEEVVFLEFEDGRITHSLENRLRVVDVMRRYAPDIVLTHFQDDMHPDHQATSRLVTDAYYMASLPLVETEHPPCDPDNVYFFGKPTSTFEPTCLVDISGYEDRKTEAIKQHDSQVEFLTEHGGIDAEFDNLIDSVRAEDMVYGTQVGADAAEGFLPLHELAQEYLV
ncbi:PIG-L deacetylase family protein [Halocatena salina]|uniref:PIG-L family deacetylase n=1 Tax=Halocatena salina TaxID=2934340 RepID=A0A8U0A4Y6_9EURY|nr:PIG-L family deacetylase [Halocatena salina]UPM42977.1 PIG-L family deacetylase [Halocatena salina]